MSEDSDVPRVSMQVSRGIVVASIQVDLRDDVLARFQRDLLERIHATGSRGVILDVSGVEVLDADEFAALRRIISMAALLGAESVLAGLRPGVVASLIELGVDICGLNAAIDLDAAFDRLEPRAQQATPADADVEPEPDAAIVEPSAEL